MSLLLALVGSSPVTGPTGVTVVATLNRGDTLFFVDRISLDGIEDVTDPEET